MGVGTSSVNSARMLEESSTHRRVEVNLGRSACGKNANDRRFDAGGKRVCVEVVASARQISERRLRRFVGSVRGIIFLFCSVSGTPNKHSAVVGCDVVSDRMCCSTGTKVCVYVCVCVCLCPYARGVTRVHSVECACYCVLGHIHEVGVNDRAVFSRRRALATLARATPLS